MSTQVASQPPSRPPLVGTGLADYDDEHPAAVWTCSMIENVVTQVVTWRAEE